MYERIDRSRSKNMMRHKRTRFGFNRPGPFVALLRILFVVMIAGSLAAACRSSKAVRKPPEFKILQTTLAKKIDVQPNGSTPIEITARFTTQDPFIISHVSYRNLSGRHDLKWEWYDPQDRLYAATEKHVIQAATDTYIEQGSSWHKIPVNASGAGKYPGKWNVKIFLDDTLVATDVFTITPTAADIDFGNYFALAIGNNNYQALPKLATPKNDIQTITELLEQNYGFSIVRLKDARRSDIILSLEKMRERLTDRDNLLIYYAGHGSLDREADEGYWLPVDARKDDKTNWISNSAIIASLKAIKAKHILVVADSCFSGKLTRGGDGLHVRLRDMGYYYHISRKRARLVLSSGGLEPVVDNAGKGSHSVFASAFLDILAENDGILDGTRVFDKIRRMVVLGSDQTPEYSDIRKSGHDGGDFLFVRQN